MDPAWGSGAGTQSQRAETGPSPRIPAAPLPPSVYVVMPQPVALVPPVTEPVPPAVRAVVAAAGRLCGERQRGERLRRCGGLGGGGGGGRPAPEGVEVAVEVRARGAGVLAALLGRPPAGRRLPRRRSSRERGRAAGHGRWRAAEGDTAGARGAVVMVLLVGVVLSVRAVVPPWVFGDIAPTMVTDGGPVVARAGADGAAVWGVGVVMVVMRVVDFWGVIVAGFPGWGPRPPMMPTSMLMADMVVVVPVEVLAVVVMIVVMVIHIAGWVYFIEIFIVQFVIEVCVYHEFVPILFYILFHLVPGVAIELVTVQVEWCALRCDDSAVCKVL